MHAWQAVDNYESPVGFQLTLIIYSICVQIDSYQDDSEEDEEDNRLASLASHSINWSANDRVADPNTRRENPDDYKVIDPLLEQGKAAFNKKQQHAKKRASEWAGRPNM